MDGTHLVGLFYTAIAFLCNASIAKNFGRDPNWNDNVQTSTGKYSYLQNSSSMGAKRLRTGSLLPQSAVTGSKFSRRRIIRQSPSDDCPRDFYLENQYCIRITDENTWTNAYEDCFRHGIEKTPLDAEQFWLNSNFVADLFTKLDKKYFSTIWLAAQRKVPGGPIYYSGPVQSDFDYYNYSMLHKFGVQWNGHFDVDAECLIFDIMNRTFDVRQCDDSFPFVCLFPSEFWKNNITYDTYISCRNTNSYCNHTNSMTWDEAKKDCVYDLIDTTNEYYPSIIESIDPSKRIDKYYKGRQNSEIRNLPSPAFFEWTKNNRTSKVFLTFKDGFMIEQNDSKHFSCVPGKNHVDKLHLSRENDVQWNMFTVRSDNKVESSRLYGIKCYLNGKLIKNNEMSNFTVAQQGNLFCESLIQTPTKLIKSNSVLVENPNVLTFVCEILVEGEKYDFNLHDLSFKRDENGSTWYYEKLLKQKLKEIEFSITNVAEIRPESIKIALQIEVLGTEDQISDVYRNVSSLMEFRDTTLKQKNITVNYLRNVKYCLPEIVRVSGCETNITWLQTLYGKNDECIACNMLYGRVCIDTSSAGAKWKDYPPITDPNDSRTRRLCNTEEYLGKVAALINNVSREQDTGNRTNLTSIVIKDFEQLLFGKEINRSIEVDNSPVVIYSASLKKNINGYYLQKMEYFKIISGNKTIESQLEHEQVIFALRLKYNDSYGPEDGKESILLSYFENDIIFPIKSNVYTRASSVLLLNVSDTESLIFPIEIIFTLDLHNESNASPVCGFWNEKENKWDIIQRDKLEGKAKNGLYNCSYYHLSCFALLMQERNHDHEYALNIITQIGCYLSLVGLGIIIAAYIGQCRWRDKDKHHDQKILGFLSLSLFIMYLLFVAGIDQVPQHQIGLCIAVGAFLHYSILASFCWMSIVAFNNYRKFVKVVGIHIPRFMWKASLYALTVPLIPVTIILSINPRLYTDGTICWVHSEGFYYGFLLPSCFFWLSNIVIFILILRNICSKTMDPSRHSKDRSLLVSQVVLSVFLSIMLGLSWVFGFLTTTQISVAFSYLFCITTASQGFLMFVFFVLLEMKRKSRWTKLFGSCFERKGDVTSGAPSTSMTLTG